TNGKLSTTSSTERGGSPGSSRAASSEIPVTPPSNRPLGSMKASRPRAAEKTPATRSTIPPVDESVAKSAFLPPSPGTSTCMWCTCADSRIMRFKSAAVRLGKYDLSTAATPAVTGEAMLVPLSEPYLLPGSVE
nr:hypothetical protein [Tanacetum cinerariifolium]